MQQIQLDKDEVNGMSTKTYERWREYWHTNLDHNSKYKYPIDYTINKTGENRGALIFSFGGSFRENVDQVKRNQLHLTHDVICVDKAFGALLDEGIIPTHVVLSDARVEITDIIDTNKYKPSITNKVKLCACVTGNTSIVDFWAKNNPKNILWYVNKDGIKTHKEFKKWFKHSSGEKDEAYLIPAATNVGNTAVVFASIILGYKDIKLFAYDYSFDAINGSYYGTRDAKDRDIQINKKVLMNHATLIDLANNVVNTSQNMLFSAKWLTGFIQHMQPKGFSIINCTGHGILFSPVLAKFN